MPLTQPPPDTARIRRVRVVVAFVLVAILGAAVYAFSSGPRPAPSEERASVALIDPDRRSDRDDAPTVLTERPSPDEPESDEPDDDRPTGDRDRGETPTDQPEPRLTEPSLTEPRVNEPAASGPAGQGPLGTTRPATSAPVPPVAPGSDDPGPSHPDGQTIGETPSAPIPIEGPVSGPEADPPARPDEPAPTVPPVHFEQQVIEIPLLEIDQKNCPNLGLVAIGDAPEGDEELAAHHAAFRAMAADELTRPVLVCAEPMFRWEDLVAQRLIVEGYPEGVLLAAADHTGPVLKATMAEWEVYQVRQDEAGNLLGPPVSRSKLGGAEVLVTTNGGLVAASRGDKPMPLVGGAWDRWLSTGGATGSMGLPQGYPHGSIWLSSETGLPVVGAVQDFSNGWLGLPGVQTPLEAAAQPAEAYEWHPHDELIDTSVFHGKIIEVANSHLTYYVDHDGVRHWITTTSDWMCATWDLGAESVTVRGFQASQLPLGDPFVCPG